MLTPLSIPCDQSIRDCPCTLDPVSNYSSEEPDRPVVFCTVTVAARTGTSFAEPCTKTCERPRNPGTPPELECSVDSETYLCAQSDAQDCQNHDPDPPNVYRNTYLNQEQTCTVECPDGTTFGWTVAAGIIASAWQADANTRASALACKLATKNRICFATDSPLTPLCVGTFASVPILAQGGTTPYVFSLDSGSLPPGMSFDEVGLIQGTPTTNGSYTFSIRVTDDIGSFQIKSFTVRVVEITTASPLPDAVLSTPYNQALAASGTTGTVIWSLASGSLPVGLTMSQDGVISGTPEASGVSNFTVSLLDGGGASCQKAFQLTVTVVAALQGYWAFEAKTGGGSNFIADLSGHGHPISGVAGAPAIVAGVVGNAIDSNGLQFNVEGFPFGATLGGGLTVCGWFQLDAANPDGNVNSLTFIGAPFIELSTLGGNAFLQDNTFVPITALVPVSNGVWYFYRMWYDPTADTWNLQIDNGTINSSTALGLNPAATINTFEFLDAGPIALLDETGYWSRVLTNFEATNVYNSGSGITFGNPNLPP